VSTEAASIPPRLIDWTGERCVPWTDDIQLVYEHVHRYYFAATLVAGRRVVDLGSGEGYGTAILATRASEAVGIDLDADTVEHSRLNYQRPNLSFVQGSMLDLEALPAKSFDVVTCFEALVHVDDHQRLLEVVDNLLRADGVFIVSAPDREVYTDVLHQDNPYHVHELNKDEFVSLLKTRFEHVELWGQMVSAGSLLYQMNGVKQPRAEVLAVGLDDEAWALRPEIRPTYLIAVAAHQPVPRLPGVSTLIDPDIELIRQALRQRDGATADASALRANNLRLADQVAHLEDQIARLEAGLREMGRMLEVERAHLSSEIRAITSSKGWRAITAYRRIHHGVRRAIVGLPEPSRAGRSKDDPDSPPRSP